MLRSIPSAIDDALDTVCEPNAVLSQFVAYASMTFFPFPFLASSVCLVFSSFPFSFFVFLSCLSFILCPFFRSFFFFILRRMRKKKALLAHHTSTYFYTRRVSILLSCFRSPTLAGAPFGSHCRYSVSCPYQWSPLQPRQRKLLFFQLAWVCRAYA